MESKFLELSEYNRGLAEIEELIRDKKCRIKIAKDHLGAYNTEHANWWGKLEYIQSRKQSKSWFFLVGATLFFTFYFCSGTSSSSVFGLTLLNFYAFQLNIRTLYIREYLYAKTIAAIILLVSLYAFLFH